MPLPRRRSSWIDPSSSSPSARKHPRRRRRSRGTWFVPPRRLARGRRGAEGVGRAPRDVPQRVLLGVELPDIVHAGPAVRRRAPVVQSPPRRPRARGETPIPTRGRGASPNVTTAFRVRAPASPRATTPPLVARDDAEVVATPPLAVHPTGVIAAARSGVAGRDQTRSSVGPRGALFRTKRAIPRRVASASRPADILRKIAPVGFC